MRAYLKHILAGYWSVTVVPIVLWVGLWMWVIIRTTGGLRIQFAFSFVLATLLMSIPVIHIISDSYKRGKDASAIIALAIFINYYALIVYHFRRKNLKEFGDEFRL